MEGWIKTHRRFLKWEWFKTPNMYHMFSYLLMSANTEDGKWQGIDIKRGQVITGLKSLKENTGINTQSLRTCMKRLKSTGEITVKVTNKYSIVTICKYEDYQSRNFDTNKQTNNPANKQLTSNQQSTNNKQEYKEPKEGEEGKISLADLKKSEEADEAFIKLVEENY